MIKNIKMMRFTRYFISIIIIFALSGCHAFLATGAVAAGQVATDKRSAGHIVDDVLIKARLANKYTDDVQQRFCHVTIKVNEGRVLLTGTVKTDQDLHAANRIAWEVRGTKEVINELQVAEKTSVWSASKDMIIKSRIKTKFALRRGFRSANYNVLVTNGVVYLFGIARDDAERDVAADVARRIKGVRRVVNYVILENDERRA